MIGLQIWTLTLYFRYLKASQYNVALYENKISVMSEKRSRHIAKMFDFKS